MKLCSKSFGKLFPARPNSILQAALLGRHRLGTLCCTPTTGPLIHTVTDKPERTQRKKSNDKTTSWSVEESGTRLQWQRPDLHLVLVHPQIPQNAGNVARTAAATAVALHLVEPLGFALDDKKLKRAGLDYWEFVCVKVHKSWQAFYQFFQDIEGPKRLVAFTVYGKTYYGGPEFQYHPGDWLVFGAETSGLPLEAHHDIETSGDAGALVKIPIIDTHVRSLNLAVSVGVGVYEAIRQLDSNHEVAPRLQPSLEEVAAAYSASKTAGCPSSSSSQQPALNASPP